MMQLLRFIGHLHAVVVATAGISDV